MELEERLSMLKNATSKEITDMKNTLENDRKKWNTVKWIKLIILILIFIQVKKFQLVLKFKFSTNWFLFQLKERTQLEQQSQKIWKLKLESDVVADSLMQRLGQMVDEHISDIVSLLLFLRFLLRFFLWFETWNLFK